MTTETTTHKLDRTGWDSGPWDSEPDKLNWMTKAGLPGMIVRNRSGALCGYVAVNPDHPLYGKHYDEVGVDVHGGLTYSNACRGVICHIPEPGQPDNVWWFGFDCHHLMDYAPGMAAVMKRAGIPNEAESPIHYKPIGYVRQEVESLAEQLTAPKGNSNQ
jgi:hypothetical protein